ncbi:hypothetical protein [Parasedimentitalea psychrophila]|uniref:Excinuclease ABC subunit A n=1 Tax=Parasedimentitalea psychrophila TaxID=2997337 RepID=A0A9Y2KYS0_9RHOB|nr:hypothetical protein [Parasedimentitalea psychrophila]WIY23644.1 hypothetical protein QPJ95_13400 [Parasedimentitalea psychrophila]
MKMLVYTAAFAAFCATLLSGAAWADSGNSKGKHKFKVTRQAPAHLPETRYGSPVRNCPPGLAKKSPRCIPPGQVRKRYNTGDRILNEYILVDTPGRWGLRSDGYYLRAGNYIYEVSRDTHKVLNLIGAVADILN